MDIDLKELLIIAKEAAIKAGEDVLKIYGLDDFNIEIKEDNSPLTMADSASHNVICDLLKDIDIPILSEEGRDIQYNERKEWEYFWLIDPLDGTKEFVKRNGEFTVNIALIKGNRPVLGVVYAPVLNWLYWGGLNLGAFKRTDEGTKSIHTTTPDLSHAGLKVVASRSHLNVETESFLNTLKDPGIVSMGSSLKFMLVAEGAADLYPRYAPTMEWDTAAAQAVVEAAGGQVYKEPGREQMIYNKEDLLNPHFLVLG